MGEWAFVASQTQATDGRCFVIQGTQVLSLKAVDAVDSDPTQFTGQVLLGSLQPVGYVFSIGHGSRATDNFDP
jgi:hypothetical protein